MIAEPRFRQMCIAFLLLMGRLSFSSVVYGQYGGGSGTSENPYQIWTADHMNQIGLHQEDWDKHFILMDDIDLSDYSDDSFNIIGNPEIPFSGVFNGNEKK